ncbi:MULTISPECIES: class F sortase [Streptomyces]|uniref:Class F sortase n=1 Tax=Streptomyces diastaticus subsp. diastaticus TaxID=68040 RepID=A0ABQ1CSG5_STRDI|nr:MULTISPECIES: class F sortase [Streptomyces]MBL3803223.1 class F sortase [Streptomyces sp. BRB081]MDQ0292261.1 sortase (surface protein transpeptidase) [Streptomyces sp. DSM 41037]GFH68889.1 class F sortase [Streptomyces rutgersensis]GFH73297.1 class F sortase [Streptomyces diastaticus subsp. diastaticus]GGU10608.1 class F sortase [Streptomyces diastaticus subsp. diastaticus]
MSFTPHMPRRIAVLAAAAGLLLAPLTGCGTDGTPEASAGAPSPTRSARTEHAPDAPAAPAPTRVVVPSVGVDSTLMRLGLNQDGTVEVPPAEKGMTAGWYAGGAVPGEPGAAVLIGHNSTRFGKAVFHDLHEITEGADITVSDGAGGEAHFTVTGKETVRKDGFPTEKVYGATGERVLRLITCDGDFDAEGHPVDNLIVYATLR